MIRSIQLGYSYTLTLILALPAAAFIVRLFILFHDCVHGSLFRRQGINTFFGYFLDARGFGDIWTMTLTEYENVSKKKRLQYWLYRNPVVMLGLGALFMFLLRNPTSDAMGEAKRTNEHCFHQSAHRRRGFGCRPVYWMANIPLDPVGYCCH
jgi:omega-6 fatty acid desaturase (delta-12 desaturase)